MEGLNWLYHLSLHCFPVLLVPFPTSHRCWRYLATVDQSLSPTWSTISPKIMSSYLKWLLPLGSNFFSSNNKYWLILYETLIKKSELYFLNTNNFQFIQNMIIILKSDSNIKSHLLISHTYQSSQSPFCHFPMFLLRLWSDYQPFLSISCRKEPLSPYLSPAPSVNRLPSLNY